MSKSSTIRSSRSHNRSISPPCMDQGSLWKLILNWSTPLRHTKHKVKDDDKCKTVVIGVGKHTGNGTHAFVNNAMQKFLYFSYRNCFTPLPNGSTTDTWWGCLIRTGQMLMAYAMTRFYYNKLLESEENKIKQRKKKENINGESNKVSKNEETSKEENYNRNGVCVNNNDSGDIDDFLQEAGKCTLMCDPSHGSNGSSINDELWESAKMKSRELFMDEPSAPFSIHRLENEAYKRGVPYATWLSPTPIAYALATAGAQFREETKNNYCSNNDDDAKNNCNENSNNVPVIICCEGRIVDKNVVQAHLLRGEHVILLIPVYLGMGRLNDKYKKALYSLLEMHSACGAAGGQDRASLFIMGYHRERVLVLDPHIIQRAYISAETAGRTSGKYYMISINSIDPCMLVGFYLNNTSAFDVFEKELAELNKPLLFELISITWKEEELLQQEQEKYTADNSEMEEHVLDEHDIEVTWSSAQDDSVFEEEQNEVEDNVNNPEPDKNKMEATSKLDDDDNVLIEAKGNADDEDIDAVVKFTKQPSLNPLKPRQEY